MKDIYLTLTQKLGYVLGARTADRIEIYIEDHINKYATAVSLYGDLTFEETINYIFNDLMDHGELELNEQKGAKKYIELYYKNYFFDCEEDE